MMLAIDLIRVSPGEMGSSMGVVEGGFEPTSHAHRRLASCFVAF